MMRERIPLQTTSIANEAGNADFVIDSRVNDRRLKCSTVADDFGRECIDITVDFGISVQYVTRLPDHAASLRGTRDRAADGGREFTSHAFMGWAFGMGCGTS